MAQKPKSVKIRKIESRGEGSEHSKLCVCLVCGRPRFGPQYCEVPSVLPGVTAEHRARSRSETLGMAYKPQNNSNQDQREYKQLISSILYGFRSTARNNS